MSPLLDSDIHKCHLIIKELRIIVLMKDEEIAKLKAIGGVTTKMN